MRSDERDFLCQMIIQDVEEVVDAIHEESGALRIDYYRADGAKRFMLAIPPNPAEWRDRDEFVEQVRRTIAADNRLAAHT